jgi:hypothetical protein
MAVSIYDSDGHCTTYGGYSDAALHLTLLHRKLFTRQALYRWWSKRGLNGFPEAEKITMHDGKTSDLLDLSKVERWYATYVPPVGRPPRTVKETS